LDTADFRLIQTTFQVPSPQKASYYIHIMTVGDITLWQ